MPTQTSQLITNLEKIYNTKLEIKSVLGTNSDIFEDYPSYISSALSAAGEIPAGYTYVSGTSYITTNGSHDVSSYTYAYVTVEGGGSSSSSDPWYDYTSLQTMIGNEDTTADYVSTTICSDFSVSLDENDVPELISWVDNVMIDTGEVGQNDEPIFETKTVKVMITGDPHEQFGEAQTIAQSLEDYSDLYDNVFPILENATLTESADPQIDGYDYLLEGDLYGWNMQDNFSPVEEITENGFYPSNYELGYNINVIPTADGTGVFFINDSGEESKSGGIFESIKRYSWRAFEDLGDTAPESYYIYGIFDANDNLIEGQLNSNESGWKGWVNVYDSNLDDYVEMFMYWSAGNGGQEEFTEPYTIKRKEVNNGSVDSTWTECTVNGDEHIPETDIFGNNWERMYFVDFDGNGTHLYADGVDLGVVEELEPEP